MGRLIILAGLAIGLFSLMPPLISKFMQTNGYSDSPSSAYALKAEQGTKNNKQAARSGHVYLKANSKGHFLTRARLNGKSIRVLVDTGATAVVLSYQDARKIGLTPHISDFNVRVQTANGEGRAAEIKLRSVEVGTIREKNISALIAPKGALTVSLLGMTFLKELKRFELAGNRLILEN
ncbi:MAG: TIGR02281 family clan AA aspartic protease [Cohaesibacter sp.]|nr:TIGR02281 family clan AA aspartic protease [Cohaesibacter sp.]